jgi:hypothetical protein
MKKREGGEKVSYARSAAAPDVVEVSWREARDSKEGGRATKGSAASPEQQADNHTRTSTQEVKGNEVR